MTSPHDLITTQEVCEILDLTPSGVSRLVDRGGLTPERKLAGRNGAFLFNRSDVEKLRDQRAADAEAASA